MIDVMRLRPDQIETYVHLQSTHDRQIATAMRVQALREYYDGDHPVMLTETTKGVSRLTGRRRCVPLCPQSDQDHH